MCIPGPDSPIPLNGSEGMFNTLGIPGPDSTITINGSEWMFNTLGIPGPDSTITLNDSWNKLYRSYFIGCLV